MSHNSMELLNNFIVKMHFVHLDKHIRKTLYTIACIQ